MSKAAIATGRIKVIFIPFVRVKYLKVCVF